MYMSLTVCMSCVCDFPKRSEEGIESYWIFRQV